MVMSESSGKSLGLLLIRRVLSKVSGWEVSGWEVSGWEVSGWEDFRAGVRSIVLVMTFLYDTFRMRLGAS